MGYIHDEQGRLVCDNCGIAGGVSKRTCPHKVTNENGRVLSYCYPAALCSQCYRKLGGAKGVHGTCAEGAARRQAEYDAVRAKLATGELQVCSAYGDWHEAVPEGLVGVCFIGASNETYYVLVRKADYDPNVRRWLSQYPDAQPWIDHPGATSKQVILG
jgi:hypothetical protein